MSEPCYDLAIVGGGIVGLATARAVVNSLVGSLVLLEAEPRLAQHQSGRNSGVIHAGLYYRPGSLKASLCADGREDLYRYCAEREIPARRCGKLVVATRPAQRAALAELERRALANGLEGVEVLDPRGLRSREPAAVGIAGLWVPHTGVVDYRRVAEALAADVAAGGEVRISARVTAIERGRDGWLVATSSGALRCRHLINCAGLYSDRVARLCGVDPEVRIVPFRGDYFELAPERRDLVRALIYPVPDPHLPFLGVHLTRGIDDRVLAGPNAVLALQRTGYRALSFSARDTLETLSWPGFWLLVRRFWRTGAAEIRRSFSRPALVRALQEMVPAIGEADLRPTASGVRAQAVDRYGRLVDDFHLVASDRAIHVLNAPSPAATAALAIGRHLASLAAQRFGLRRRARAGPPTP